MDEIGVLYDMTLQFSEQTPVVWKNVLLALCEF